MDINDILKKVPHRYPFIMVDRVEEYTLGESIRAYKNVSVNEPFFQGHFPEKPVMPGVLIVEALAQAAGVLAYQTLQLEGEKRLLYFTGIDGLRFKRQVIPGDKLTLIGTILRRKGRVWKFTGRAEVDGELVCEGTLMCMEGETIS